MNRSFTLKLLTLAAILLTILSLSAQSDTTFTAPAGENAFGKSVAIFGNWAIVGSPQHHNSDGSDNNRGKIFIYHLNSDNQWLLYNSIICPENDSDGSVKFGYSVAIDSTWAFIGAPEFNFTSGGISYYGVVYKFELVNNNWVNRGTLPITSNTASSHFGCSISMNGNYAAVLADEDPDNPGNNGRLFVYKLDDNIWSYSDFRQVDGTFGGAEYGQQIALKYPQVIVGTPGTDNVHIVNFTEPNGTDHHSVTNFESNFGENISIYESTVFISSDLTIHRYQLEGNGLTQPQTLNDPSNPTNSLVEGFDFCGDYIIVSYSYPNNNDISSKISIFKMGGNSPCAIIPTQLIYGAVKIFDPHFIVGGSEILFGEYKFQNVKISITLDTELGHIEYSTITYTNLANDHQEILHPNANGICNKDFFHNANGSYRIKIEKEGFYPCFIDSVSINSNNSDIAYNVNLSRIEYQVNISHNLPNAFHTVQEGINYAISHHLNTVSVYPETFFENIDIQPTSESTELRLIGIGSGAIIDGQNNGNPCISIANSEISHLNLQIENLTLQHGTNGISSNYVPFESNTVPKIITEINVTNCIIENCGFSSIQQTLHFNGCGVFSDGPIHLHACTITDNQGFDLNGSLYISNGGGLYLVNNCSSQFPTVIDSCEISYNTASETGGIYLTGTGKIVLTKNKIFSNRRIRDSHYVHGVMCQNATNLTIANNLMYDNGSSNTIYGVNLSISNSGSNQTTLCNISNNTITDNIVGIMIFGANTYPHLSNNIIMNNSLGFESNSDIAHNHIYMRYNSFWNNENDFSGYEYDSFLNSGCVFADPALDENYVPLWNPAVKSPCIDSGEPMQYDADGTQSDIGCYPAITHFQKTYVLDEVEDLTKYYWMCFPVLDNITAGENIAANFFDGLLVTIWDEGLQENIPEFLREIVWMEADATKYILWEPGNGSQGSWNNNTAAHEVTSERGYKIRLNPGFNTVSLSEIGFPADPNAVISLTSNCENWIGYTLAGSSMPQDALASIWDDIIMIKTKDWCMTRISGDYWVSAKKIYPINYGDMVVITTHNDHEFHWGDPDITNPEKMPEPKHFVFPEKLDYVPVYINLKEVDMTNLQEIGLNINSSCKGAVVVTDSLVMLSAFMEGDEVISGENAEFVFYYETKNQPQEMRTVHITPSMFKKSFIDGNAAYPYYQVNIRESDVNSPVNNVTALDQNFPNPFNPSTTISYSLKEDGKVALDIFNIRGQLVKSLASGLVTKGMHSIVWDGKDITGNSCASGVYLYKLKTGSTSITRKMMMLK